MPISVALRWVKLGCLVLVGIVLALGLSCPLQMVGPGPAVAHPFVYGHSHLTAENSSSEAIAAAANLNQKAWEYYIADNYLQAEPLYRQALALQQQHLDPNHPEIAKTLNNLGLLYWRTGNYPQAEHYLMDALQLRKQHLQVNPEDFITSLINLGAFYRQRGNYEAAIALFEEFLGLVPQVPNLSPYHKADGLNSLGLLFQGLGDYSYAEDALQDSLRIRQTELGDDHPQVADSLLNLAGLHRAMGNMATAKDLLVRSHTIYRNSLGDRHPRVALSLQNLAFVYQSLGLETEAIAALQTATDIEEDQLARMVTIGPEHQKQTYLDKLFGTTQVVHSLAMAHPTLEVRELALTTVLRRKGRILDAQANAFQTLRQQLDDDGEAQAILSQLDSVRQQLLHPPSPDPSPTDGQTSYARLLQQEQALETQLYRHSATAQIIDEPVTIAQVQAHIPAQGALVEYVRYTTFETQAGGDHPWGQPHYAAYILRANGPPHMVDLGPARPIEDTIQGFRGQLERRDWADLREMTEVEAKGHALYNLILEPIIPYLAGIEQMLISPDGALNLIPFEALTTASGRFLIEAYSFTYLTSGRDLLRFPVLPTSHNPTAIFADPDYGPPRAQETAASRATAHPGFASLSFSSLLGSRQEGEALNALFSQASQPVRLYMGAAATTDQLKQAIAPQILHIATHGFFLADPTLAPLPPGESSVARQPSLPIPNPLMRSGLAMAGANRTMTAGNGGLLTALDLVGLNLLGTQLAVLSACDTGRGNIRNGEGVYGLRRALAIAGVQSQVISLWPVEDLATKELMVDYYQRLLANEEPMGRHEALRQAQLAMLHSPAHRHPYYWAAFIASGDWRPLEF